MSPARSEPRLYAVTNSRGGSGMKVWGVLLVGLLVVAVAVSVAAAQEQLGGPAHTLDAEAVAERSALPNLDVVEQLRAEATRSFDAGEFDKALDLLQEWARQANALANVVTGALRPYHSASPTDQRKLLAWRLAQLLVYEQIAASLIVQRNHAMVMQAECLVKLGRLNEAAAVYLKALDLLPINDWDWWVRALNGLYALVGVPQIK